MQGLRIDRDDLANQLNAANGKKLQITHELEAQKDEVQNKKAEVKKLNERMDTLIREKDEAIQSKMIAERKLVSIAALSFTIWICILGISHRRT